ncbi:putative membrane protein [Candidatus Protochlamydia naegleriophila]|uniref:Putative membrane protein n=1 Tax=Candidatus Protochlamydia naegleriophila TaxID=389348 RepID=A0A0U5EQ27_9BACT|nr:hypothetical protein [Candidatus Protochlamydia naegleriophila]CUI16065.1 putative membrane protein [Candidatus Protochlamydia naegleriophila]
MVKKVCLISFIVVCFGIGLFYQTIQLTAIKWVVQTYSQHHFGQPLDFKHAYLQHNRLIIQSPELGKDEFKAHELAIGCTLDIWNRQVGLFIALDKPWFRLKESTPKELDKWQSLTDHKKAWVDVHPTISVKEGELVWNLEDQLRTLRFDLSLNDRDGGYIKAYLDGDQSQNYLIVEASSAPETMLVHCECKDVDCAALLALSKIWMREWDAWHLTSGVLNGEVDAIFGSHARPYLKGELLVDQLAFSQEKAQITGKIEQARLHLEKNNRPGEEASSLTTVGYLDLLKPASLAYQLMDEEGWRVDQLQGRIGIDSFKKARIALEADGYYHHHHSHFNLKGEANLNARHNLNLDLDLLCSSSDQPGGHIQLFLHQTTEGPQIKVQLNKLSYIECGFLQRVLAVYWPQLKDVHLQQGVFEASFIANLTRQGLETIRFKRMQVDDLKFKLCPLNTHCSLKQARGYGSVNLRAPDIWHSTNMELHIDDGHVQLSGLDPRLPLTAIQTHLKIEQGTIPHALVAMQFAGLKGAMDIEWGEGKEIITVKLNGEAQNLAEFLPNRLQEGLQNHFNRDQLTILANIKRHAGHIELIGAMNVMQGKSEHGHLIHFGGELKKIAGDAEKIFAPVGWFYAKDLPLEKFVSPFIFRKGVLQMRGKAEVKGSLDDNILTVKYDADQLSIENEDLLIEAKQLRSTVPGQLLGLHQFDFKTCTHQGALPIQQASYLEKNSGLYFGDIQGKVLFRDQTIHISSMEAYCHDVYFAGCLDLDYSDPAPGVFNLKIKSPTFAGKVSQIQYLLSHFDTPSIFKNLQLEGELNARGQGITLAFDFLPGDYRLQADFKGVLQEGFLPVESSDMSLKGLYLDIDYHHDDKCLALSDIQGVLLVGKPRRVQEYAFTGRHLCLIGIDNPTFDADVSVKDGDDELMRLVAITKEVGNGDRAVLIDSSLSHLSHIYPKVFNCQIGPDGGLQAFDFESRFELGAVAKDVCRFKESGLLFLSHSMIGRLDSLGSMEGAVELALHYDPVEKCSEYQLESQNLRFSSGPLHTGLLKGKKRDKRWMIEHVQWDQFNSFADLHQMPDKWKINFLGLNDGESLVVGLEGDFEPESGEIDIKINLCEINLERLEKWSFFKEAATHWNPRGTMQIKGAIQLAPASETSDFRMQGLLTAQTEDLSLRNFPIDMAPLSLRIQSDQEVRIEGLNLQINRQSGQWAELVFHHLTYNRKLKQLSCPKLDFSLPANHLSELAFALNQYFPDFVDEEGSDVLRHAKQEGQLNGSLEFTKDHVRQSMTLALSDGTYFFKKRPYDLHHFSATIADKKLSFSAMTRQERFSFQIKGVAAWPLLNEGEYYFLGGSLPAKPPLIIKWQRHPEKGYYIYQAKGYFCGLDFDLEQAADGEAVKDWSRLQGIVGVDFNLLCPLVPDSVVSSIQKLKLGSNYQLKGYYWMNPDIGPSLLETLFFQGTLSCQEAALKGYIVNYFEANLNYQPKRLDIARLTIQDPAGSLEGLQLIAVENEEKDWLLFMPSLTIRNFKPSLLREDVQSPSLPSKFKTLIVRRFDLEDFYGNLSDLQSWRADGRLHFLNSSRKNTVHPLLAIPGEIILRLGLDPQVLNPVNGTIYFNMQGDRFYLTRFKDVYSEGRGSKFYLARSETPSWVDMDGQMSVQIRMKQYNLIFKIAELFTVSIQGSLKKPTYALQKQTKASRKGAAALLH